MFNNQDHALKVLNFYRWEVQHEFNLLNHRVSWYILSQTFLITAFVVSIGYKTDNFNWFKIILPVLGILTSIIVWRGIDDACETINMWVSKQRHFLQNENKNKRLDVFMIRRDYYKELSEDKAHGRSLLSAKLLPWIMGLMWFVILVLTFTNKITIK
jgi:hypothetical protein